ncbi:LytR/AlgR family response regulator transcription factor [Anaerosporobacter sp.]|uniref:LytR/AlgR family response regulator transcription factor n=1 Tax=Anaerosporobacter sp. TaxID=1872529 RepID=UPI00286F3456|nr:LytTR family DNA-binding domain-containing protein [Anaerosporobacter sp.]
MIRIGICDDVKSHRIQIEEQCNAIFKPQNIECEYKLFTSGEEVVEYEGEEIHLLFLDIEMEGINGIEVKKYLESKDTVWKIVFVSNHDEVVFDAFGIKTLGFSKKPVDKNKLELWLSTVMEENNENLEIIFRVFERERRETLENIIYIKAEGHYVYVKTKEDYFLASERLKNWQKRLESTSIIRVHNSYMVNLLYISYIADNILLNYVHETIPVGRKYRNEIKIAYHDFVKRRMKRRMLS